MNPTSTAIRGLPRSEHRPSNHVVHEGKAFMPNQAILKSMTEDEVRGIVADFNQNINVVLLENEELKSKMDSFSKQNKDAEEQLHVLEGHNKMLKEEKDHYEDLCQKYETRLEEREKDLITKELSKLTMLKESDLHGEVARYKEAIEAGIGNADEKNMLLQFVNDYEKMKQDMIDFSLQFEYVAKENERLKEEINKSQKEQNALKQCMRCHEKFSPLLNNEQACVFHPGKLKYYSCRGCGADEYWSCCNRCTNCQKGCREGKHLNL